MPHALSVIRMPDMTGAFAEAWWQLYESTFPASERRGAALHAEAMKDAAFHCLSLVDDAGFAGLLAYWKWDTLIYVEHLAVSTEHRGQGIGHAVLDMLPGTVILEIEPVVDSATACRLAFYESCGFVRLPQPHVQLAYQTGEEDIALWLLSRPAADAGVVERFEELFHAGPMRYRDSA